MATKGSTLRARRVWVCQRGGEGEHNVEVGEPFTWYKRSRRGQRQIACARHPFHPNELRTYGTGKTEQLRELVERFDAASFEGPGDLKEGLEEIIAQAREYAEEYENGVQSMEEHFPNGTEQMETMTATAEGLTTWADELDAVDLDNVELDDNDLPLSAEWWEKIDLSCFDDLPGYGG